MTRASPASSPRLPSPPPIAEDQLGPKSPVAAVREDQGGVLGSSDSGADRRIRPGTKAADMAEGPPVVEMTEIDSAFQLTEHLKALHYHLTHPPSTPQISRPLDRTLSMQLAEPPEGVDKHLWLFELCRFLTQKANSIVVALFADNPPCSAMTCPEMRASEWQYLCAVHDPPKSCSAIDYCCHTLDWAANVLTSPKNFPSRLALFGSTNNPGDSNAAANGPNPGVQLRHLTNIFRRVYRIFAHAWFSHREQFWRVEGRTGLYVLFKTVCDAYSLIPPDNYTIPDEAEGLPRESSSPPGAAAVDSKPPEDLQMLLRTDSGELADPAGSSLSAGNTTKRHRANPSVSSVSMVIEEAEEEEEGEKDAKHAADASAPAEPAAEKEPEPEEMTPVEPRAPADGTADSIPDAPPAAAASDESDAGKSAEDAPAATTETAGVEAEAEEETKVEETKDTTEATEATEATGTGDGAADAPEKEASKEENEDPASQ